MKIVWDEHKRRANIAKHGIDFADIPADFFAEAVLKPARYGRVAAFGWLHGPVAVVFAVLGTEGISLVSARPASRKERRALS